MLWVVEVIQFQEFLRTELVKRSAARGVPVPARVITPNSDKLNSQHPRLEHSAWDGLVLPVDDPFWQMHYPVKAWRCKCGVTALNGSMLERRRLKVSEAPEEEITPM